jgi:microcystin-dependent protein
VGEITMFPLDPGTNVVARGGTATGTEPYIECDGSIYTISVFPTLGALYGATFGGNGSTTFGVPNTKDTGRYLRSRSGVGGQAPTLGAAQSNQNQSHNHTFSGTTGVENQGITFNFSGGGTTSNQSNDHVHFFSATTSGFSNDHTHSWGGSFQSDGQSNQHHHDYNETNNNNAAVNATGANTTVNSGEHAATTGDASSDHSHNVNVGGNTGGSSANHSHSVSGNTGGVSAGHTHIFSFSGTTATQNNNHTHNFSGTVTTQGGTEARPESFVVMTTVKT